MTIGNTNWGKITHNTKTFMQVGLAGVFVVLAGTAIYAAAKGAALPLAFLAQPWVIAAIVSLVAVYFIVTALSSYYAEEAQGKNGAPGKDANFATLVKDVVKSGTIVEETVKKDGENDVQQLFLTLPIADYKELAKNNESVHILLANGKVVELDHKVPGANATEYKVQITKVAEKTTVADMKAELGMDADSKSLKVAVSDKDLETLKDKVVTNLTNPAISEAAPRITK